MGGMNLSKKEGFKQKKRVINGKIGHVCVK